jgi:hypothetical protein
MAEPSWKLYRAAGEICDLSRSAELQKRGVEFFNQIADLKQEDEELDWYRIAILPGYMKEGDLERAIDLVFNRAENAGDTVEGRQLTRQWRQFCNEYWERRLDALLDDYRLHRGNALPPPDPRGDIIPLLEWEIAELRGRSDIHGPARIGPCAFSRYPRGHLLHWEPGLAPVEWFGYSYRIDRARGTVYSESRRILDYDTAIDDLNSMSTMLSSRNFYNTPASDLGELVERIKAKGDNGKPMAKPREPFSPLFGQKWEFPSAPEGAGYSYDRETGRITPTPGYAREDVMAHPRRSGETALEQDWTPRQTVQGR